MLSQGKYGEGKGLVVPMLFSTEHSNTNDLDLSNSNTSVVECLLVSDNSAFAKDRPTEDETQMVRRRLDFLLTTSPGADSVQDMNNDVIDYDQQENNVDVDESGSDEAKVRRHGNQNGADGKENISTFCRPWEVSAVNS